MKSEIQWFKATLVGLLGSLVMLILIKLGIHSGNAPFNIPPSGAFLVKLGITAAPVALLVHFLYGAFWSVMLIKLCKTGASIAKGVKLAVLLWLVMMLIYSPIIGWGVFGFGATAHALPATNPLHLGSPVKYLVATLVLHLVYGILVGWLDRRWIAHSAPKTDS